MSFIKIIEEKNPVEMHNKVYEASKNNELTPEFCMEVLSHTNVPVIMGKMLEEIEKLPIEEQGQYKEVILSMFDYRQTSETVRDKALVVAKNNGFESELNKVIKETGEGGYPTKFGCDKIFVLGEKKYLRENNDALYYEYKNVDFSSYKGVIVNGKIEETIYITSNSSLKGVLNLRGGKKVGLKDCDLSKVTKIIFEEGAEVYLDGAKNLPSNLDVSMCDGVGLDYCDLKGVNDLKFREGAEVGMQCTYNLPKDLDVSMCDWVKLIGGDLEEIKLKFREGSAVCLEEARLPHDLDVSMCDWVDLSGCNLSEINLKFREGSKVVLRNVKEFPEKLDVSMCDEVNMEYTDISNVKELKFKNKKQMKESKVKIPEGWGGKFIYEDVVSTWNKIKNVFGKDK